MALSLDQIRALADRIAASHHLEVVEIEFSGGSKHRSLRVFIEKDAETRARLAAEASATELRDEAEGAPMLPKGIPPEILSFVTHDDCTAFAQDFGTTLDVEELIPGDEYTLEVSSPGLERKLTRPADFARFTGSLVKLQTFTAVEGNRHFQGRLTGFADSIVTLDQGAIKQKGRAKKGAAATGVGVVQLPFANVEKANLIAEI
jgi:ribosome maturation factor RimP